MWSVQRITAFYFPLLVDQTLTVDEAMEKISKNYGNELRTEFILRYIDMRIVKRTKKPI
jgi:hypothetical protein